MPHPYSLVIYALGFVGLAAISLIPLRVWHLLRHARGRFKLVSLLIGLFAALTLAFEAKIVLRVFNCLIGEYCGPSVAHGWFFLAMLGAAYLAFEAAVAAVSMVARFSSRSAA